MGKRVNLSDEALLRQMLAALQRSERAVSWIYRWQVPRAVRSRLRIMLSQYHERGALRKLGDQILQLDPNGRYFSLHLRRLAEGKREKDAIKEAAAIILRRWEKRGKEK